MKALVLTFGAVLCAPALCLLTAAAASAPAPAIQFADITNKAGIHFSHHSGLTGKKFLPETLGAGCAFIDIDGDGWPSILLINGKDFPNVKNAKAHTATRYLPALYRNNHNGTFTDITRGSGLDVEMYGMGVSVADYDNDGLPDVYITALEGDRLFHNEGHG
ncbi:MAG TPA: VCBS repeat-containing protein, partial [Bryobacteraceae bacterium]